MGEALFVRISIFQSQLRLLCPVHAVAHTEVGVRLGIDDRLCDGHQLLCAIEERERTGLLHRQVDGFLQQVHVIMTVEHEAVGVVVVEEEHQFKVGRILGEVVGNLAA